MSLYRYINPAMNRLLHSSAHWVMSRRIMTVTYQGRKSGNNYCTPVSYYRDDDAVYCFTNGKWRFNFSRDNHNFIEIAIDTKDLYRFLLECRYRKTIWKFSWSATYRKDYHIPTINDLNTLVAKFYTMELEEYRQYFDNLHYRCVLLEEYLPIPAEGSVSYRLLFLLPL